MNRYFVLKNLETLEVISAPFEKQPENSLPYYVNEFKKAVFNQYPNPTKVVEGWTENDIPHLISPEQVPLWCVKVVLHELGLIEQVEEALSQLPEPNKTRANYIWEYGNIIQRQSPTVAFIGQVLGLADSQMDELFINADSIDL
jgi:hypothetical protein